MTLSQLWDQLWEKNAPRLTASTPGRYALAFAAVLAMLGARTVFDPILGPGAYYFLYYPGVVLIAYVLGFGPAAVAIATAGLMSYLVFAQPGPGIKTDAYANLRLLLFVGSAMALVFLVARVRERLDALEAGASKASAQSQSQADLFREYAGRVSSHMQLLSALLQLKARDEPTPDYARVLMNAASRTMLLSRLHRSFSSADDAAHVDFSAFAERLADSALEACGHPPLLISLDGELALPPEQAISLALILLEYINARARNPAPGHLRISFSGVGEEAVLTIAEEKPPTTTESASAAALIGALAEQMGGRLVFGRTPDRSQFRFVFPTAQQPLPVWDPLQALH